MNPVILVGLAAAASASGLNGPIPKNAQNWIFNSDYPQSSERKNEQLWAFFKMIVSPDGAPLRCVVQAGTGDDLFKKGLCDKIMGRAKFEAAHDVNGQPAYGVFERMVNFTSFGRLPMVAGPDYELQVQSFPDPKTFFIPVEVHVGVDQAGGYQGCVVPKDVPAPNAPYAKIACQQMAGLWAPMPERDEKGQPMSYVRVVRVSFTKPMPAGGMPGMPGGPGGPPKKN